MDRRELETALLAAPEREAFLLAHSGLPGPRGNLELIDVASAASERAEIERWAVLTPAEAPENTPGVFLACVGLVGLGRLVAAGDRSLLPVLRRSSSDPRWRVREAVAMALQAWGDLDIRSLVAEMERWAGGSHLEGRAAMAALWVMPEQPITSISASWMIPSLTFKVSLQAPCWGAHQPTPWVSPEMSLISLACTQRPSWGMGEGPWLGPWATRHMCWTSVE